MYAVVKTGGKQYKVAANDILKVEKLEGQAGDTITLDEVLLVSDDKGVRAGAPLVDGVSVSAQILEQTKGDTIIVFKKKRRHQYRRRNGHRQLLTVLKILEIGASGAAPKAKKAAKEDVSTEEPKAPAKKAAPKKAAEGEKAAPKKAPAKKPAAKKAAADKE